MVDPECQGSHPTSNLLNGLKIEYLEQLFILLPIFIYVINQKQVG